MGYRKAGEKAVHASPEIMESIGRLASLGSNNIASTRGRFEWTLTLVIPVSCFWQSDLKCLSGMEAKANFYKCGDDLSTPHFASWSAIDTPTPSFHQPKYFGQLVFQ